MEDKPVSWSDPEPWGDVPNIDGLIQTGAFPVESDDSTVSGGINITRKQRVGCHCSECGAWHFCQEGGV